MLKIKIVDLFVNIRSGEKDGRKWTIRSQENCFLEINGEIRKFPVNLQDDQKPYEAGYYTFDAEKLLTVGRFGLEVDRFKLLDLVPIAAPLSKAS